MEFVSTITSKGQVLIPAPIRKKLGIKPNDRVTFNVTGKRIVVEKTPSIAEMKGFLKFKKKLSDEELEKAINKATIKGILEDL